MMLKVAAHPTRMVPSGTCYRCPQDRETQIIEVGG